MGRVQELLDEAYNEEVHTFKKLLQNIELEGCMHLVRELAKYDTHFDQHEVVQNLIEVAKNVIKIEEAQESYYSSISPK